MLVADGPYSSNPEAARKQYQDLINIISEMTKKRSECPEALSDTRWLQMEQALQERKTKLNSLLIESERFWEEIGSVTQDLATIDEEIASQQPPSVLEGIILHFGVRTRMTFIVQNDCYFRQKWPLNGRL